MQIITTSTSFLRYYVYTSHQFPELEAIKFVSFNKLSRTCYMPCSVLGAGTTKARSPFWNQTQVPGLEAGILIGTKVSLSCRSISVDLPLIV